MEIRLGLFQGKKETPVPVPVILHKMMTKINSLGSFFVDKMCLLHCEMQEGKWKNPSAKAGTESVTVLYGKNFCIKKKITATFSL